MERKKTNLDGLSGLAGIFIKYIYAGCGKIQRLYFSTPVYRKFKKPVTTPTTHQESAWKGHKKSGAHFLPPLLFTFLNINAYVQSP